MRTADGDDTPLELNFSFEETDVDDASTEKKASLEKEKTERLDSSEEEGGLAIFDVPASSDLERPFIPFTLDSEGADDVRSDASVAPPEPEKVEQYENVPLELGLAGDFSVEPVAEKSSPPEIREGFDIPLELGSSGDDFPVFVADESGSPGADPFPVAFSPPATAEKDAFVEEVLSLATGISASLSSSSPSVSSSTSSDVPLAGDWGVRLPTHAGGLEPAGEGLFAKTRKSTPTDVAQAELSRPFDFQGAATQKQQHSQEERPTQKIPEHRTDHGAEQPTLKEPGQEGELSSAAVDVPLWNLGASAEGGMGIPVSTSALFVSTPAASLEQTSESSDSLELSDTPHFSSGDVSVNGETDSNPHLNLRGSEEGRGEDTETKAFANEGGANEPALKIGVQEEKKEDAARIEREHPRDASPAGGGPAGMTESKGWKSLSFGRRIRSALSYAASRFSSPTPHAAPDSVGDTKGNRQKAIAAFGALVCIAFVLSFIALDEDLAQETGLSEVLVAAGLQSSDESPQEVPLGEPPPAEAPADGSVQGSAMLQATEDDSEVDPQDEARSRSVATTSETTLAAKESPFDGIPSHDFGLVGKNGAYLQSVEEAILRGDYVLARRRFSLPPPVKPEQPVEALLAKELLTRYYMGVSSLVKAPNVLRSECVDPTPDNAYACPHHVRALLSAGDFAGARRFLSKARVAARESDAWKRMGVVLSLLDSALPALERSSLDDIRPLLAHFLSQPNLNAEWYQQRSVWMVRAFSRLSRRERMVLTAEVFGSQRKEWEGVLSSTEGVYNRGSDTLLVPYLNLLAVDFEFPPFELSAARARTDTDAAATGVLFQALRKTYVEPTQNVLTSLVALRGREILSDALRVMQMNMALQDNEMGIVHQALEILRSVEPQNLPFRYEWALVRARYAAQTSSPEVWTEGLMFLMESARAESSAVNDFQYWLLHGRLLRLLRRDPSFSLRRAMAVALTPKERGLVLVEEAQLLRARGKGKEAFARLRSAVRTYPHHGPLLQAAAELAGQAGFDPTVYISKQGSIPADFVKRSQDVAPLSDATLQKILEKL
jgi:hypothetical protein